MPSAKKPAGGEKPARGAKTRSAAPKPHAKRAAAPKTARTPAPAEDVRVLPAESPEPRIKEPRVRRPEGPTITIVQYVSGIACPVRHKRVLRALGLRHPHHRVVRPDNPAVRGMVNAIPHLVRIEEAKRGA